MCNYVDVYKNDKITERMTFMRATATPDEIERFRLQVGDVLITKDSEAWNDIGVPSLVMESAADLISGYHLALLRPRASRLTGGYLLRSLQSKPVAYQFHVEANGVTRYGLSHSAIKSVALPLPPLQEQTAIVRFLDHADRGIRRYIRAKQKMIELLEEQKQAIIVGALACGLDPQVKMRESGIEWPTEVPAHWGIQRLSTLCDFRSAKAHEAFVDESGEFVCVNARFVSTGGKAVKFCTKNLSPARRNDVLMVMSDLPNGRALARAFLVDDDRQYAVNQRVCIISPRAVHPRFLSYQLNRNVLFLRHDDGSNQTHLPNSVFTKFPVLTPPLPEQVAIANHVDQATRSIDVAVKNATREVELVREYRTRLIADVVTGKLDVHDAASGLPEAADDDDPGGDAEPEANIEDTDDINGVPEEAEA